MELTSDESYYLQQVDQGALANDPTTAYAFTYLYRSYLNGHLCAFVSKESIEPDPSIFDLNDLSLLRDGISKLRKKASTFLVFDEDAVYFKKNYEIETRLLAALQKISHEAFNPMNEMGSVYLENATDEQNTFIQKALTERFTFLTGGPGTGKTHTVGNFLQVYWDQLRAVDRRSCRIALCAPTGKAASHLKLGIERQGVSLELLSCCSAQTMHALLGLYKNAVQPKYHKLRPIPYQLIIVDESSMIDARMMLALFESLQENTKLILVGDPNQLPPVDTGQILPDLIALYPERKTELKKCFRIEGEVLRNFAHAVNEGDFSQSWNLFGRSDELSIDSKIQIGDKALNRFVMEIIRERALATVSDLKQAFTIYNGFRVLTPLKKGAAGYLHINKIFKSKLPAKGIYIPIMITKNSPAQELYNGDTGILYLKDEEVCSPRNIAFFSTGIDAYSKVPAPLLPAFELGFALSVHKSQGSEFNDVYTVLPEGSEAFGREVLYTAATRAKKSLKIWGDKKTFHETLKKRSRKVSGLQKLSSVCSSAEF